MHSTAPTTYTFWGDALALRLPRREGELLVLSIPVAPWNCKSLAYLDALEIAIDVAAADDDSVCALLFTAEGEAHFSVGMVMKELLHGVAASTRYSTSACTCCARSNCSTGPRSSRCSDTALPLDEALAVAPEAVRACVASGNQDEGLRAFSEKRPPRFPQP